MANERAASLEKEAAQLRLDLEKERSIRSARRITPAQKRELVECLSQQPKGIVFVWPKSFDNEAEDFAKGIRDTLSDAGFEVRENAEAILSWSASGSALLLHNLETPPNHALPLQQCFLTQGFKLEAYKSDKVPPDAVAIAISTRF